MKNDNEIQIYFGKECSNLYTLGYVSADLFQLLAFCEMIDNEDFINLNKFFPSEGPRSFFLTRYSKIVTERIKGSQVSEVKNGSIEVILASASLAAAIIMPIVAILVERELARRNKTVTFNISTSDQNLQYFLNRYKLGIYGQGIEGRNRFFEELGNNNFRVTAINQDTFDIENLTRYYTSRIAKTLHMN